MVVGRGGVAAGVRLGDREAHDPVALEERRQPSALLLLGAEQQQLLRPEGQRAQLLADAGVDLPELLQDQGLFEVAQARAAVGLGDEQPDQPEAARLLDDVERHLLLDVAGERHLGKFAAGKLPGRLLDLLLLAGKIEIHPVQSFLECRYIS